MSSVYNTEPPTNGKVVLKTTLGDVDLELWPKEVFGPRSQLRVTCGCGMQHAACNACN